MTTIKRRKVALVTGASSGIGQAAAEAFVRGGYATVLVDQDEAGGRMAEEKLRAVGDCSFFHCNVTDDDRVRQAVDHAVSMYDALDVAFNAAAINGAFAPIAEATEENWNKVMSVNLKGVWHCMRHELRQMLKQGGGAIVNCASSAGIVGAPGLSAYVAAKHGVVGLTRSAALEYARQGIRVNAICPGMIDTPMWRSSIPPEWTETLLKDDPIGRLGQPTEVAALALWLCDDKASFMNGAIIPVDGGMTTR